MKTLIIISTIMIFLIFILKKLKSQKSEFKETIVEGSYSLIYKVIDGEAFLSEKIEIPFDYLKDIKKELKQIKQNSHPFPAVSQGMLLLKLENNKKLIIETIYNMKANEYYNLIYINNQQYIISESFKTLVNHLSKI